MGDEGAVALSKVLPSLTQLLRLDVSWNEIGTEGVVALSRALPSLTQLQKLNLSGNRIAPRDQAAVLTTFAGSWIRF